MFRVAGSQLACRRARQRAQGAGQLGVGGEHPADVGIGVGDQGEVPGRVRRDLLTLQTRRRRPAGAGAVRDVEAEDRDRGCVGYRVRGQA